MFIFSIGTNLPEITVAITSWKKNRQNYPLVISWLHNNKCPYFRIHEYNKTHNNKSRTFLYNTNVFVAIILILTAIFYKTKKSLDRIEGVFLILTYLAFLYVTLVMQIKII